MRPLSTEDREGLSAAEIGRRLGVSRQAVLQAERNGIRRLWRTGVLLERERREAEAAAARRGCGWWNHNP